MAIGTRQRHLPTIPGSRYSLLILASLSRARKGLRGFAQAVAFGTSAGRKTAIVVAYESANALFDSFGLAGETVALRGHAGRRARMWGDAVRNLISGLLVPALVAASVAGNPGRAATNACPSFPPVMSLVLNGIYSDAKGSIPDQAAVQTNRELTASITNFLNSVEQALDSPGAHPGDARADCAFANFQQWAHAGALTIEPKPYNRQGTVARGEYLIGLEILALKFREAGFPPDKDVLAWLRTLNSENMNFWMRASNRGNLRIWAGAAAALHAVLERDPAAMAFQDQVWLEALAAIHDNGTIDAEMARSHRALIYHMFSFSATLVLRSARAALGEPETPPEKARLKLLADGIGRALCDPHEMEREAKAAQESPGDFAYRVIIGFGTDLLSADWSHCGMPHVPLADPTSGGDTRHSAQVLSRIAQGTRHAPVN
jgi:hypothetical protein